ncbi:MAG: heme biosynthesis protein HemY [Rickettsiaceae bacterium H1]|nr:heme biosynthesis protein HemY [Rickettsiaceae bacterium H1]
MSIKHMSIITQDIIFTQSAIVKIRSILEQEKNNKVLFRIKVEGGGCSGFQYKFDIDSAKNEEYDNDEGYESSDGDLFANEKESKREYVVNDERGFPIAIIDNESFDYLKNCTVDYVEDLTKSDFVIRNPQATAKCGCGNSFAVKK